MVRPFRIYINAACPHCNSAVEFLRSKHVPFEVIEVGFDPIIAKGLAAHYGQPGAMVVPTLVSFMTQDTIGGWVPQEYARVMDAYAFLTAGGGAKPGDPPPNGGVSFSAPEKVADSANPTTWPIA